MKTCRDTRLSARAFQLSLVAATGRKELRREQILATPTHPDYSYHQFKSLIVDKYTITITRRICTDRSSFTCRVLQITLSAA